MRFHFLASRWFILMLGWMLFWTTLWLPAVYWPGNAWSNGGVYRNWIILIFSVIAILEPLNAIKGFREAFIIGNGIIVVVGTLFFLLSPVFLALQHQSRIIIRLSWIAPSLLAIWLIPISSWLADEQVHYLYGYYGLAIGYTLVFLAIVPFPWNRRSKWRGFEPILQPDDQ